MPALRRSAGPRRSDSLWRAERDDSSSEEWCACDDSSSDSLWRAERDDSSSEEWCAYDDSREPPPPAQRALPLARTLGARCLWRAEPPVQPHDDLVTDFTDHGRAPKKRRRKMAGGHPHVQPSKAGPGDHMYGPGWDCREPESIDDLVEVLRGIAGSARDSILCTPDRAYLHRLAEEHPESKAWRDLEVYDVRLELIPDLPGVEGELGTIAIRFGRPEEVSRI